jgi:hypothetical protein
MCLFVYVLGAGGSGEVHLCVMCYVLEHINLTRKVQEQQQQEIPKTNTKQENILKLKSNKQYYIINNFSIIIIMHYYARRPHATCVAKIDSSCYRLVAIDY